MVESMTPLAETGRSAGAWTPLPLAPAVNLRGAGPAFLAAAAVTLDLGLPTEPNRFVEAGGRTAIWLGPDEWLILGTAADTTFEAALSDGLARTGAAVTDVTGNRVAFRIAGDDARDVLAAGCSLDLHPRAFAPGHCAQTLLARTGIILLQRDLTPTFDVHVRRSFAGYLTEWLSRVVAIAGRS